MDGFKPATALSGTAKPLHSPHPASVPETVKLRGHHLLCILTYIGKGYTEEFVANFDSIVERINRGVQVEIITGMDDICASLRDGAKLLCGHARVCSGARIKNRDVLALAAVARALQMPALKAGDKIKIGKGEVKYLRRFFADNSIRHACEGCDWRDTCSTIAQSHYKGARLLAKAVP